MKKSKLNKETYLPYPVCFKEFTIGPEKLHTHHDYHDNEYYKEKRFTPHEFYKAIIKL
jgi:aminopeptidase C